MGNRLRLFLVQNKLATLVYPSQCGARNSKIIIINEPQPPQRDDRIERSEILSELGRMSVANPSLTIKL